MSIDTIISLGALGASIFYTSNKTTALISSTFAELKARDEEHSRNHAIHFKTQELQNATIEELKNEQIILKHKMEVIEKKIMQYEKVA